MNCEGFELIWLENSCDWDKLYLLYTPIPLEMKTPQSDWQLFGMVSITFKVYRRERVIPIQTWHSDAIMSPVGFSLLYGLIGK